MRFAAIMLVCALSACAAPAGNLSQGSLPTERVRPLSAGQDSALLYVGYGLGGVIIYDYATLAEVGQLYGFESANGMCVDDEQNVYVTDYNKKEVFKYAPGAEEPEKTFDDSAGFGVGCAVNGSTGDLAVTNSTLVDQECGDVEIYPNGSGSPTSYTTGNVCEDSDAAYDGAGNLFVAGLTEGGTYAMAELPHGKTSFASVTFDTTPQYPSGLQWDGTYLETGSEVFNGAFVGSDVPVIYRFSVSGQTATLHQTVLLDQMEGMINFFLPKFGPGIKDPLPRRVVAVGQAPVFVATTEVADYRFPMGGAPRRSFTFSVLGSSIVVAKGAP